MRLCTPALAALALLSCAAGALASADSLADKLHDDWQADLAALKTKKERPFNFGFSGSGGMLPFHLGVAQALVDYQVIRPSTKFAGISGGAIASTLLATEVSPMKAVWTLLTLTLGAAAGPQADAAADPDAGTLAFLLRLILNELLPADASALANRGGRLHVFASQVNPANASILPPSPTAFDLAAYPGGFSSRADLIESAIASAYVPCGVGGLVGTPLRGKTWIDGGAAASLDDLCHAVRAPAGLLSPAPACVKIIAVTLGPRGNTTCTPPPPPANPPNPGTYPGYTDVSSPALTLNCTQYAATNGRSAISDFHPVRVPVTPGGICPGCRVSTHFTQCDITAFSSSSPAGSTPADTVRQGWAILKLGYEEGEAWAKENGFRKYT